MASSETWKKTALRMANEAFAKVKSGELRHAPPKDYDYPASKSGRYVLKRDGKSVLRGTEQDIWTYVHQTHCYSVSHAIQHEGYTIEADVEP